MHLWPKRCTFETRIVKFAPFISESVVHTRVHSESAEGWGATESALSTERFATHGKRVVNKALTQPEYRSAHERKGEKPHTHTRTHLFSLIVSYIPTKWHILIKQSIAS